MEYPYIEKPRLSDEEYRKRKINRKINFRILGITILLITIFASLTYILAFHII